VALGRRPVYVISIAAGLAGCHPRTLRIYEEEGLLEPVRTQTNIRLYSDDDLERVRAIRYLTQIREELAAQDEAPAAQAAVYQERGDETANDAGRPRPRNRSRRNGVEL